MSNSQDKPNALAPLEKTLFQGAELSNCAFEEVKVGRCQIVNAAVSQTRFANSEFKNCTFEKTAITSCLILDGVVDGLEAHRLQAIGVVLDGARLKRVSLKNVTIENANCTGLVINGVNVGEIIKARMPKKKPSFGVNLRSAATRSQ